MGNFYKWHLTNNPNFKLKKNDATAPIDKRWQQTKVLILKLTTKTIPPTQTLYRPIESLRTWSFVFSGVLQNKTKYHIKLTFVLDICGRSVSLKKNKIKKTIKVLNTGALVLACWQNFS